jgi:hypothetical protein
MTQLDEKLREMAINNWEQFVQLVGQDAIVRAKSCMLRSHGRSYGEISIALGISYNSARERIRYNCGGCDLPQTEE